jgi:methionine-rich copper-binding protein CopC
MENSFKPSPKLKVLMGIAACLVLISLYFFIMAMIHSPSDSPNSNAHSNISSSEIAALNAKITSIENQRTALQASLDEKQSLIEELQSQSAPAQCEQDEQSDTLLEEKNVCEQRLSSARTELSGTQRSLQTMASELAVLKEQNEELAQVSTENTREQDIAAQESERLAAETLALMTEENAVLVARIAEVEAELEETKQNVVDSASLNLLQLQLTSAEDENTRLLSQLNELQAQSVQQSETEQTPSDEGDDSVISFNELAHTKFEASPSLCATEFADGRICVESVEVELSFNFNPNGFVRFRLVGPDGDTIDRQSVAGRTINTVSFDLDPEDGALPGEYTVEFNIDDVFNNYKASETFVL